MRLLLLVGICILELSVLAMSYQDDFLAVFVALFHFECFYGFCLEVLLADLFQLQLWVL